MGGASPILRFFLNERKIIYIVLNLNISFNICARLGFNVIWLVKCMKMRKLKIEMISI